MTASAHLVILAWHVIAANLPETIFDLNKKHTQKGCLFHFGACPTKVKTGFFGQALDRQSHRLTQHPDHAQQPQSE